MLKTLHWLPVDVRIDYKIALLCHKCMNNKAPLHLKDLIKPCTPSRLLRSSEINLLTMPTVRTKLGERTFCFYAPKIWNSLPKDLRFITSENRFKQCLKTHFFNKAFGDNSQLLVCVSVCVWVFVCICAIAWVWNGWFAQKSFKIVCTFYVVIVYSAQSLTVRNKRYISLLHYYYY